MVSYHGPKRDKRPKKGDVLSTYKEEVIDIKEILKRWYVSEKERRGLSVRKRVVSKW